MQTLRFHSPTDAPLATSQPEDRALLLEKLAQAQQMLEQLTAELEAGYSRTASQLQQQNRSLYAQVHSLEGQLERARVQRQGVLQEETRLNTLITALEEEQGEQQVTLERVSVLFEERYERQMAQVEVRIQRQQQLGERLRQQCDGFADSVALLAQLSARSFSKALRA